MTILWQGLRGARCLQINNIHGCALCDATWGEYWDDVENERMRFCCNICAFALKNMISEVKKSAHWPRLEKIEIQGDNTAGRKCLAAYNGNEFRFYIKFSNDGRISDFHRL